MLTNIKGNMQIPLSSFHKPTRNNSFPVPFTEQIPVVNDESDSETEVPFQLTSPQINIPALHPYRSSFAQEKNEREDHTEFYVGTKRSGIPLV